MTTTPESDNPNEPHGRSSDQTPPPFEAGAEWLTGRGRDADVVMSSRVRLARNLVGFPFAPTATDDDRRHLLGAARPHVSAANDDGKAALTWVDVHELPAIDRELLVERHLISRQHARGKLSSGVGGVDTPRALAVSLPDEKLAIMVNEEDHLRIQRIHAGLDLSAALAAVDAADDRIEASLDYAFNPRFGYLTCCPTNVGTGARFSVMLHLPALRLTGEIEKVKRAAEGMSLAVRGFYGEGSDASGDFYQLSNQTTLGKSERVLLAELEADIVPKVIDYERMARRKLLSRKTPILQDQVHRAMGVLAHARLLSTEESMKLLRLLRLGVVSELIDSTDLLTVHHLMLLTQPAHLQRAVGEELDQDQRRSARADLIRAKLG